MASTFFFGMVKIAQITDTHLLADPEDNMRGVKTWYSLKKVLKTVQSHHPEFLLLTGDLAHNGEKEAYQHLVELIEEIEIPAYWLPGNHDHLPLMQSELVSDYLSDRYSISTKHWQIILLNSCLETANYGEGTFAQTELNFLAQQLAENKEKSVAIACHHQPINVGIDWLEEMSVLNSGEFRKIIGHYPQVKVVCFGHIHHQVDRQQQGIYFLGTPATCTQVTPAGKELIEGEVQTWQQPGFRILELKDNGEIKTDVYRINWF